MPVWILPFIERFATAALRSVLVTILTHQVEKTAKAAYSAISGSDWPWWLKALAIHALETFIDGQAGPEQAGDVAASTLRSWMGQLVSKQMTHDAHATADAFTDADVVLAAASADPPAGVSLLAWLNDIAKKSNATLETILELREVGRNSKENGPWTS